MRKAKQKHFTLDAEGVVYGSLLRDRETEGTAHNPIDVLIWGMSVEDPEAFCFRCDKWSGIDANGDRVSPRRDGETAERPPGARSRGSCDGCFVSYWDRTQQPARPDVKRYAAKRREYQAEWRALVQDGTELLEERPRCITRREKEDWNSRWTLVEIKVRNLRRACVAIGYDPVRQSASGGFGKDVKP